VHGLLGFKINGGAGLNGGLHLAFAVLFYVSAAAAFVAITIAEWRAALCPAALTAARGAILAASVATMIACVALFSLHGCVASHITAVDAPSESDPPCLSLSVAPACAAAVRAAPPECAAPPALEITAVGLLLAFLPTLAFSLHGAAVTVEVPPAVAAVPGAAAGAAHSRRGGRAAAAASGTFDAMYARTRELHVLLPERMVASVEALLFSLQVCA
jgi:hypothetical protein